LDDVTDPDSADTPVRATSRSDQAWADLAAELTPAKSLARVDTVTARAVTTVTFIGVLLTGLGAFSAGLAAHTGPARGLAMAAVITAALAVASALTAQVLTITRRLNTANLAEVRAWYQRQFDTRAYPTRAATILLLLAALLTGASATASLATSPSTAPAIDATQTVEPGSAGNETTITVQVTFHGLAPGQAATVTITTPGTARVLGSAVTTPPPDGTAVTTMTLNHLAGAMPIIIVTRTARQLCRATFNPAQSQPILACRTTN
jgi:hypothetical protein